MPARRAVGAANVGAGCASAQPDTSTQIAPREAARGGATRGARVIGGCAAALAASMEKPVKRLQHVVLLIQPDDNGFTVSRSHSGKFTGPLPTGRDGREECQD